jgi:F-type H+-transporting ATPase subunit delta
MSKNSEAYALQLFSDAYEEGQVEEVRAELKATLALIKKEDSIITILRNPSADLEERKGFIQRIFEGKLSNTTIHFLGLLLEEESFELLDEIGILYDQGVKQYLEDYLGIIEGEVYSAIPLTDDQLRQLILTFERKYQKEVRFISIIDTSLIGGYRVKIKSKVYDDTIKLQLNQLKESLEKS